MHWDNYYKLCVYETIYMERYVYVILYYPTLSKCYFLI